MKMKHKADCFLCTFSGSFPLDEDQCTCGLTNLEKQMERPHHPQSPEFEPEQCSMCTELAEAYGLCLICVVRNTVPSLTKDQAFELLEVLGLN